jgi:hypothetical protein
MMTRVRCVSSAYGFRCATGTPLARPFILRVHSRYAQDGRAQGRTSAHMVNYLRRCIECNLPLGKKDRFCPRCGARQPREPSCIGKVRR